ncbi:MAG TPA: hypothetical protein PLA50_03870 [Bacteroidia bacterium]|nr:hypothetical protein [Bacteroidia bacterium]
MKRLKPETCFDPTNALWAIILLALVAALIFIFRKAILRKVPRKWFPFVRSVDPRGFPNVVRTAEPPPPPPRSARQAPHELDRHLLNLVDLLDEIEGMRKSGGDQSGGLGVVESRLADLIELSDGEIIRDTEWQPDRQRAVEVVSASEGAPRVLSSRKSGLAVGGRIVRKQEVVLSKTESTT